MRLALCSVVLLSCSAVGPRAVSTTTVTGARLSTPMNLHAVTEVEVEPRVQRLLDAPDRDEADRTLDGARQSGDLLTYLDVWPGMRVAEIGAGSGYLTELLARSVGPRGHVIAQNDSALLRGDVRDAWASRLARPAMRNVEALDSAYATPLPPGTRNLDCVYVGAEYGLLVARGVDRAAMNRAAYAALAPGGRYVVLDRVLPPDSIEGHREASASARREIESAGFSFKSEGRFLRGSNDARDWNAAPNARAGDGRGAGDWFLLTFVKRAQPTLP